jgi:molybdopterin converting factor subunit 1
MGSIDIEGYNISELMKLKLLFFGATADLIGEREQSLDLTEGSTVCELVEGLKAKYPRLAGQNLLFAVNEEYADPATPLQNGNEVAIFTPVSGG